MALVFSLIGVVWTAGLEGQAKVMHVLRLGGSAGADTGAGFLSCSLSEVAWFEMGFLPPQANVIHLGRPSSASTDFSGLFCLSPTMTGSLWGDFSSVGMDSLIKVGGKGGLGVLSRVPGLVRSLSLVSSAVEATLWLLQADMPRTMALAR